MLDDEKLAEIFRIYKPMESKPILYRAYYDAKTLEVLHLSQEELDLPFINITPEQFASGATDIWCVADGRLERKDQYYQSRFRLRKGETYATIKGDMQFAVPHDWAGDKDFWDAS